MNDELWSLIRADLYRCRAATDRRSLAEAWFREPGFRFLYYLRKTAFHARRRRGFGHVRYVYNRVLLNHYRFRYGFDISPLTQLGPGLYLGHFGSVVISPFAVLGANVNVAQGVTIGSTSRGARRGAPTLEDQVWVGAHAVIVGKVTIGREALIAPGAYVNFDVPARAVVIGNPGRIVSHNGSDGYISNVSPSPR